MDVETVLVAVGTSTVVAAGVTSFWTGVIERDKQLRERRMILAGDFAGEAMEALAKLRHYKPTTGPGHRNEGLHSDIALRSERAEAVNASIDRLRPLRGRVWLMFPGRSLREVVRIEGPQTTADWAERVIGELRAVQQSCDKFWNACDQQPGSRPAHEAFFDKAYDQAKANAWTAIDQFAVSAGPWVDAQPRGRFAGGLRSIMSRRSEAPELRGAATEAPERS